jgi:hypothetical protein
VLDQLECNGEAVAFAWDQHAPGQLADTQAYEVRYRVESLATRSTVSEGLLWVSAPNAEEASKRATAWVHIDETELSTVEEEIVGIRLLD